MQIYIHTLLAPPLRNRLLEGLGNGHTILFREPEDSSETAREKFTGSQWVLGNPPSEWLNADSETLEFWQLDSAGFDKFSTVNVQAKVANMGDWFARPCAETIVGGLIAFFRGVDTLTVLKQQKTWVGHALRPQLRLLDGQKVVILGSGTIGKAIKEMLTGFRCEILTLARSSPEAELHTKEELLAQLPTVDILISTLPGTADRFVDQQVIDAMKPGSVYANVGRGNTTDEAALIDALQRGHLSGAVLDVTELEPLPEDHVLWTMPNVVLTQHTGGGQADEDSGKVAVFVRNCQALMEGKSIENQIDLTKGY
ncbi:D-2-hydroxyacid dehydrogenase [Arundinibacter roseus]|uniref:D-2-hydroxyacid dehydrogenase n=1 Tax=Arundinibacter roseus TaxID=2070510 RepID=A0A4R4KIJ6_9BACT|nr:D-2-hydroxyacid dehydrogenase [Arundinibacter roseus]TDB68014.1 D-2-hydroxyacid dehydrogenase [Arundinibacter roseus]